VGQKVHPFGLRLGIIKDWLSRWYAEKEYPDLLLEDMAIRKYIESEFPKAGIARVEIERRAQIIRVIIHTSKPGVVIGRRGAGVETLKEGITKLIKKRNKYQTVKKEVYITVNEVANPELEAALVGEAIVDQIEKRISFRRVMKQAALRTMKAGALGIKIECKGRLGGAEIARKERIFIGKVPLHTLRADIDYSHKEAYTTYGRVGVKVWIYRGDVFTTKESTPPVEEEVVV